MITISSPTETYAERRRRAAELCAYRPYAAEVLRLYLAVVQVQEVAALRALETGPTTVEELPGWVAENVMPELIAAAVAAGPEPLAAAAQAFLYGGDLAAPVGAWLAGVEQPPAHAFLGRAAAAPVLEVRPELRTPPAEVSPRRCPSCGGPPQVAFFGASGEALLTAPRYLQCARCATPWSYARMVCAGCGEEDTTRLPVLADHDAFANLRIDACESCRTYLVTVDLPKDPTAVPLVDELTAIPLDLAARERGFRKISANLVGT